MDWQQLLVDAEFDDRGAHLVWKPMKVRVGKVVRPAVGLRAPRWILSQVEPELQQRGGRRLELKGVSAKEWPNSYMLDSGIDEPLRQFLDTLAQTRSIGRTPIGVTHCLALDFYKLPDDSVDSSKWTNTPAGDLVHRSKYWSPPDSVRAFRALSQELANVVHGHPAFNAAMCVISIPGRDGTRPGHGERLAERVATISGKPFYPTRGLYTTRPEAKAGGSITPDLVEVDAHVFEQDVVIIVDDVFRSGNSMAAVAQKAVDAGAVRLYGLVGAKTLRN